jgi:NAD(P)-dependent dehydrogenase (short-subunit alcohol dehydrogenase family)
VTSTDAFDAKRILVVGGARAIGAEIASRLDAAGAEVLVAARDLDRAASFAQSLKHASAVRVDVLDETSVAAAAERAGELDHVASVASAHHDVPVTALEYDKMVSAFGTKVFGPLLLAKHFAPRLRPGGSLLFFSGIVGWRPKAAMVVKGIANGALACAATHLAVELAPIRVNVIAPGIVDSGTWDRLSDERKQALLTGAAADGLVGRHGELADVAGAALWLLAAGYVTGETIHVDGGARHR